MVLLTVSQVAAVLGVSKDMVYDLINQDILPHVRVGRHMRVLDTVLEQWALSGGCQPGETTRGTTKPPGKGPQRPGTGSSGGRPGEMGSRKPEAPMAKLASKPVADVVKKLVWAETIGNLIDGDEDDADFEPMV